MEVNGNKWNKICNFVANYSMEEASNNTYFCHNLDQRVN